MSGIKKIKSNWVKIFTILIAAVVLYRIYYIDLYTYFCEEESNAPACYVLSKELEKLDKDSKAKRYLKVSCDLKYERACKEIANE